MTTCNCEPKLKLRCENVSKTFIQKGNQEVPVIRDVTLDVVGMKTSFWSSSAPVSAASPRC